MNFDRTTPCGNCPFARRGRGFLTESRALEIAEAVAYASTEFPCHKTTKLDEADGERIRHDGETFCAGAIGFSFYVAPYENQMIRFAAQFGLIDPEKFQDMPDVFMCEEEMAQYHKEGSGK